MNMNTISYNTPEFLGIHDSSCDFDLQILSPRLGMDVKHKKSNLPRVFCVFFPKSGIPKWILKKWPSHEKKMEQSETPDDQTFADDMFAIHNATLEQRSFVGFIGLILS